MIVFLSVAHETRMARLRERELARYGGSLEPGGDREAGYREFMDWANGYKDPQFDGRNRARHEEWLSTLHCPVLRLDSTRGIGELVVAVTSTAPA